MEKEAKENKKDEKKFKKKKSVNWDSKIFDNKEQEKKPEVKIGEGDKDFLEIEVINKDGNTIKERVKYERKESKEFTKKREENIHNEYTKAKEFLEQHKSEEQNKIVLLNIY